MTDYTYAAARVRARENDLLGEKGIEALIEAPNEETVKRILREKGYRFAENASPEEIAEKATEERNAFLAETLEKEMLLFLRLPDDFHNLKAALKAVRAGAAVPGIYVKAGIDGETIEEAVKTRNYSALPKHIKDAAEEGWTLLTRTRDGQRLEMALDKRLFAARIETAKACREEAAERLARLEADLYNLKTAARCAAQKKSRAFTLCALCGQESRLDTEALAAAAENGSTALGAYLAQTPYSTAAEAMKHSPAALEAWCLAEKKRFFEPARYECFTLLPVLAYEETAKAEIHAVRLVLAGKRCGADKETLRQRAGVSVWQSQQ